MAAIIKDGKIEKYLTLKEWYRENQNWIREWAKNIVSVERTKGQHIFKKGCFDEKSEDLIKEQLLDEILYGCIFSKFYEHKPNSDIFANHFECMSGFYEQTGRLPKPEDKVKIEYAEDYWFKKSREYDYSIVFTTICKLVVE